MSILFFALQCFQCSTMQVKQQKKSGNKWVCVVCNAKQSVRKIYCRSYRAKDVREFVQGFNSRRSNDRSDCSGRIEPQGGCGSDGVGGGSKMLDWSEYLDVEEDGKEKDNDDNGVLVTTTEMPMEKFGRRTGSKNLKPKFSKRRVNESHQGNCGSLKCSRTDMQKAPSKWSRYLEKEDEEEVGLKFDGNDNENGLLGVKEHQIDGLIVEEEVHPDFI